VKTSALVRKYAADMLGELESSAFEYALIPAPDPMHSDHKIRAMQYTNPPWYSELCAEHVSVRGRGKKRMRRARTFIVRSEVRKSLVRIANNRADGHVYDERLVTLIRRRIAAARKKPNRGNVYGRFPDLPF
jgi:hypothetical protein